MNQKNVGSENVFEQISQICRDFRKQMSQGRSPRIEKYLSIISEDGCENLFSNLLEIEISFRRGQGESPTSAEYLKRFPQYTRLVRRAFFEPTIDPDSATDDGGATLSRGGQANDEALAPTFEIPDNNQLGDYQLLGKLGQGGMGVVYEARHTKTGNRVALKTLPTSLDGQQVDANKLYRFRKEFRSLSNVNHPNLVGMQTLEVEGNQWFFTMDLIEGDDFISYVRPKDQLDEQRLRACLPQLAKGIIALHQRGIVHRDLKPGNVMVTDQGYVRILDFGLVAELQHVADATQTRSAMFVGTIPYAAPEQMFGQRTEANDWYGFGTMVYEALAGEVPFPGNNQANLLRKQQEDPPTLEDHNDVPSDLAELVDGLLRREAEPRLGAEAVAELLHLDDDTRIQGSTLGSTQGSKGSRGSSGSVDEENVDLDTFPEEEITLIGREKQLAELEEIKEEFLKTKQPSVVWVTGLSGEGKSSLVEKFLQPIRKDKEMLVLSGRCYDRESVPYKVIDSFIDPLTRFLRSLKKEQITGLIPHDIEMLVHLFPVMRRVASLKYASMSHQLGIDERQLRNLAFAALKDLLKAIGNEIPIVIFVDDLQWGDSDSAEVLAGILKDTKPPQVLLVGSCRSDEMASSHFLKVWHQHSDAGQGINVHEIEVASLSEEQCLAFIESRFPDSSESPRQQIAELFSNSRGNPYFLEQLLEGYDEKTGAYQPVPLETIIKRRLSRCPEDSIDLLNLISVAGQSILLEEVSQASVGSENTFATIAHMRSERLVRLIGTAEEQYIDTYHDKIRETILNGLEDKSRKELHLRIANVIEHACSSSMIAGDVDSSVDFTSRIFDLAHHFFEGCHDKGFRYQLQAAHVALGTFAFPNALEHSLKAMQCQTDDASIADKHKLEFQLATAYSGCGKYQDCIDSYISASKSAATDLERARCHYGAGYAKARQGQLIDAQRHLGLALDLAKSPLPKSVAGTIFNAMKHLCVFYLLPKPIGRILLRDNRCDAEKLLASQIYQTLQYDAWTEVLPTIGAIFQRATLAKFSTDQSTMALAYTNYAINFPFAGFPKSGLKTIDAGLQSALRSGSDQILANTRANVGAFYYLRGDLDRAESYLQNACSELGRGHDYGFLTVLHWLRHVESVRGNSQRIINAAKAELHHAQANKDEMVICWAEYGLANGISRTGAFDDAIALASQSFERLSNSGHLVSHVARQELGHSYLMASNYEVAREILNLNRKKNSRALTFFELTMETYPLSLEATLGPNWFKDCKTINKDSRGLARWMSFIGWRFPTVCAHALRALGRFHASAQRPKKAKKTFNKAIAAATKIGAEYEHARALIDKSMLEYAESKLDREKGFALLESLGCVLPDAEVEYLGIDRECHHFRAKEAREAEAKRIDEEAK